MRCGTPRTRGQGRAKGASHPARLVAARSGVDVTSEFAARRGSEAGDAREVTCAASLRGPQARAKGAPRKARPGWGVRRSHRGTLLTLFKSTSASNSRKTPIGPILKRRPLPSPESYRTGRGRPHPESFTSRWGRVILFGSHTVCPLQLKSLRAHRTSTSPRTRSYPLRVHRASAKGGASSTSLAPPPTPGGQTAPKQRQDPWDPPLELKLLVFRVPETDKSLMKLPESRKAREEEGTPITSASHTKAS